MNGYITFEQKADGLYMNIIPAKDGGTATTMEDVIFVLDKKGIPNVDLITVKSLIDKNEEASIRIGDNGIYSTAEWSDIRISRDGMLVAARFFPPFKGGRMLEADEIKNDLKYKSIKFGINENAIEAFLKEREYGKQYILAQGKKPVEGRDASLEYLFDTENRAMPKVKEDGTVDFYDLDNISHVKEGDVVARITKEVEGVPGMDVYGNILSPRKVERKIFRYGRNLKVSDDGLSLISMINGHVTLDGDRVSVSNTYTVPADVNLSVGNIDYDGDVVVSGNVISGFTVKATGNVEVRGVVEGAVIVAGGNIVLGRGIQGMQQGILKAGGSIVAKFIENAKHVEADGTIEVGAIIQSNVLGGQDVVVQGKNGLIIGGKVVAKKSISAKNIGSEMGTNTLLTVGVSPTLKLKAEELKKQIKQLGDEKEKLSTIIVTLIKKNETTPLDKPKLELLAKSKESLLALQEKLKGVLEEYSSISGELEDSSDACVKVQNNIYPGTKITIGECELFVKEKNSFCQYKRQGYEIKSFTL